MGGRMGRQPECKEVANLEDDSLLRISQRSSRGEAQSETGLV